MANITTTATDITSQPQWYQQALQNLVQQAQTTSGQPYVTYPNQRIAGFTTPQQAAFNTVTGDQSSWAPYYNMASQAYGQARDPSLNQGIFQSYFNPYTQDVVNQIQTLANQNLMENVLPGVNSTFTSAGQFGSDRNAEFINQAIRNTQQAVSQAQGQALAGGFQNQVANTQNAIQQALQSGQLMQGLGTATQQAGLTDASALSAIGQQQQNQNQANMNLAYQDFLTQQQWPYQQESYLSGILGGTPVSQASQQTTTTPGPSTTSQVIGGIAGTAGLLGALGSAAGGIGNIVSGLGLAGGGPVGAVSWDGGTPPGRTEVSGWQGDLAGTPFRKGGKPRRMQFGGSMGGFGGGIRAPSVATPAASVAPRVAAPRMGRATIARRPRFGGIASRRLGGIGMMPGAGVSGVLPGAPAGLTGRMGPAMNPGTASVIRGLSGQTADTPTPRII